MAVIVTREKGATAKGSPLTPAQMDDNLINLNTDLVALQNARNAPNGYPGLDSTGLMFEDRLPANAAVLSDIGTDPNQVPLNQYLGTLAFQNAEAVQILGGVVSAQIRRNTPVTKTASFTVAVDEQWIICNGAAAITATLPDPAISVGRELMIKTAAAFAVNSASANVVPLAGGTTGTAILSATAGKWATLVSDGTSWIIMQSA